MKAVILCCIFIFAIYFSGVNGNDSKNVKQPDNGKKIRARNLPTIVTFDDSRRNQQKSQKKVALIPITNVSLSPKLMEINDRLIMQGEEKSLTKKQGEWISRFIKTLKNWLYFIHAILKMDIFKEIYRQHCQEDFDLWITGRNHEAFDMIYQDLSDPNKHPTHYKLIIYRISYSGIGFGDFNLKSIEVGFEKSVHEMKAVDGQMVFRKDRVYTIELEAELPTIFIKIRHEIVEGKENGDFNPLQLEEKQDVKPGYLRLRLSNVKVYIKLLLTEIDKRFVQMDPDTGETYFFEVPTIVDFQFSIKQALMPRPQLQKKPNLEEGYVGKGLTESRARIILKDFVNYIVLEEHRSELSNRLKTYLTNRFSRAIMLSRNIFLVPDNLDYEGTYYKDWLPFTLNDKEMIFGLKKFYASYSFEAFFSALKDFIIKWMEIRKQSGNKVDESKLTPEELEKKKKKDEEIAAKTREIETKMREWVDRQSETAGTGMSVSDDGFDWNEDGSQQMNFDILKPPVYEEITKKRIKEKDTDEKNPNVQKQDPEDTPEEDQNSSHSPPQSEQQQQ